MIVYANGKTLGTDADGNVTSIGAIEPGLDTLKVGDMETRELLYKVIKELKILNLHMSYMTDLVIDKEEVEV